MIGNQQNNAKAFKIGDRVHDRCRGTGTVKITNPHDPYMVRVLFDADLSTPVMCYVNSLTPLPEPKISTYYGTARPAVDVNLPPRYGKTPVDADKRYEDSYRKKVVGQLLGDVNRGTCSLAHILDAVNLLKQYHRDLALPYTQRDEARAQVKELRKMNETLGRNIEELNKQLIKLREKIAAIHDYTK